MANGQYGDFESVTIKVDLDARSVEVEAVNTKDGKTYTYHGTSHRMLKSIFKKVEVAYEGARTFRARINKTSGTLLKDE